MDLVSILGLFKQFGPWALIALLLVWFGKILLDEDRSALLRAKIFRAAHRISGKVEDEKRYISNDIRGRLNLARRRLDLTGTALPSAVAIAWVDTTPGSTFDIAEGQFVVRLDPSGFQPSNVALLATAIVRRTTLVGIRHSIEDPLQTAIDLNLARHLLIQVGNKRILDWYLQNEYAPSVTRDDAIRKRNEQVVALDERGLFTRLLLVEIEAFASLMHGRPPRPYMAGEIEGLVEFLWTICSKPPGQDIPLTYQRAFIRVGIILVAKAEKLLASIEPYIKAMEINLQQELTAIYVLIFDKAWLAEADRRSERQFKKQIELLERGITRNTIAVKDFDVEYSAVDNSGNRRRARCIRYIVPFSGQ